MNTEQNKLGTMPIGRLLISMSIPMMISFFIQALYNMVDSMFVARINENALTAVSIAFPLQQIITAIGVGTGVAVNALVPRYTGQGQKDKALRIANVAVVLSFCYTILFMLVGAFGVRAYYTMQTGVTEIVEDGVQYLSVICLVCAGAFFGQNFEKLLVATGNTVHSMISQASGAIFNIIFDPLLIFGIGPFPEMGIAGAALATGIGQMMQVVFYLIIYFVRPIPVHLRRSCLHFNPRIGLQLYSIGVPAILNLALPSVLITFLNSLLAFYSQSYIVVLGIYYKLQTFLYLPANGIVQGLRPIIGYNYGAGEYGRVKKVYRTAMAMCAAIMAAGTLLCLVLSEQLIGLFSTNSETIAIGTTALRIICTGFLVSTISVVVSGSLEGLGKGIESLVISLCRYIVVIMPLAWLFCHFAGADGIWHAFWLTEFLTAAISLVVYHKSVKLNRI